MADLLSGETMDGVAAVASAIGARSGRWSRACWKARAGGWAGCCRCLARPCPWVGLRHGVYETTDFGWGRPARVEMSVGGEDARDGSDMGELGGRSMATSSSGWCCRRTP
jgi:hypothetical protein